MKAISNATPRSQVKWKRPEHADSEGTDEGGEVPDEIDVQRSHSKEDHMNEVWP
jgi:hypothetical protein